jgi:uncharacterized membrane protein YidH (DUF202 family)
MPRPRERNWFGILSFGFFILLFALFFIIVPDYSSKVSDFFNDIQMQEVIPNVFFPAPQDPHPVVYETVMNFCIVFGVFQLVVLALRIYHMSHMSKKAETISNIVIWFGAAYMFYLLSSESPSFWFPFIGGIIAVFGASIIVRSLVTLIFKRR